MSARVAEIEDLREENEVLRAALAERDGLISDRDEVIAVKDEAIDALARKLHLRAAGSALFP